jgi:nitroimidazol reductase NimA-like FMN-containing flavoprotein (pyridoxamine 5'-phosphate oxidase superfamily)
MEPIQRTERTRVRRLPDRGHYERNVINAILDEGLVCHVGFAVDGQPYVIPTVYGRAGNRLYLHGSAASRMLRTAGGGVPVCVTVTLLDGLVLARSAFHHSVNYRSVVVLGAAQAVVDPSERVTALEVISEHVVPGRWRDVRPPNEQELKATAVLRLMLTEASAKLRTGPPLDDEGDLSQACWAGVIPLRLVAQAPIPDPQLRAGIQPTPTIAAYERRRRARASD